MRHVERGGYSEDKLIDSFLHRKLETHPRKLPQYLLMPKSFFGNLDTGISLTAEDKHERAQDIYSMAGKISATRIFKGTKVSVGNEFGYYVEISLYSLIPRPLKPIILTHWHTHQRGGSLPSIADLKNMFRRQSMFSVIGSPDTNNSLFVDTEKSRNYCENNGHTVRVLGEILQHDLNYSQMDKSQRIRLIKSLGFGAYHQVRYKSETDYLWKKSR